MRIWIGWMAVLLLLGCTSAPKTTPPPAQPVIGDYRIQPGLGHKLPRDHAHMFG